MVAKLFKQLEDHLGAHIVKSSPISGGCISQALKLECSNHTHYLLKTGNATNGMFRAEANGLIELRKANAIRVPEVFLHSDSFILMEFIVTASPQQDFHTLFGTTLAQMHRYTATAFGLNQDNYIGANRQANIADDEEGDKWWVFFKNKRLVPQFELAKKNGLTDPYMQKQFGKLIEKLPEILSGDTSPPCLLHGDLWSGNYLCDENNMPCLIDPAVYYGSPETDIAMTRLFGGFPQTFYNAYQKEHLLINGWEQRQNIYKLYHILNHLNLFGKGYYHESMKLIDYYL